MLEFYVANGKSYVAKAFKVKKKLRHSLDFRVFKILLGSTELNWHCVLMRIQINY